MSTGVMGKHNRIRGISCYLYQGKDKMSRGQEGLNSTAIPPISTFNVMAKIDKNWTGISIYIYIYIYIKVAVTQFKVAKH